MSFHITSKFKTVHTSIITNFIQHYSKMSLAHIETLKNGFLYAVEAVTPKYFIRKELKVDKGKLYIRDRSYDLSRPIYVVGSGKAVLGMALELEEILGPHIKKGFVNVPEGIFENFPLTRKTKIEFNEGAILNTADERAYKGAIKIRDLLKTLQKNDLLFFLISGGSSALLPLPKSTVTLEEQNKTINYLIKRGADIVELNTVRKRLSALKGGGLAEQAYPADVIALIMSDIVGDPLDSIGSGPTFPNRDSNDAAKKVLKKYVPNYEGVPQSIRFCVDAQIEINKALLDSNQQYKHVFNVLIANNKHATAAAKEYFTKRDFQTEIISHKIAIKVDQLADIYSDLIKTMFCLNNEKTFKEDLRGFLNTVKTRLGAEPTIVDRIMELDVSKKICLIAAGEPTVVLKGDGKGGRNQHLALEVSARLDNLSIKGGKQVYFLSAGTDGIDGPTDAAGAIGTYILRSQARAEDYDLDQYIKKNDSYSFYSTFRNGSHHIKTGHTGTNVMDLHIILVIP